MGTKKIVVTGAPGTGKTVVIEGLEKAGFPCYHEIIRSMTAAAKADKTSKEQVTNPLVFVDDPYEFNLKLLEGRRGHFLDSMKIDEPICFFDRGIPDVLAYMDYFDQPYGEDFVAACTNNTYDEVLILPPWKEIYISDNERLESFAEAEEIHKHLMNTYQRFGYSPIIMPKTTIPERVTFIVKKLKQG